MLPPNSGPACAATRSSWVSECGWRSTPRSRTRRRRLTHRSTASAVPERTADERGTGLVGTLFGVTAFLLLLLFGVQVLVGLYTTTVVTATALDAASDVSHASDPTSVGAQQAATARARSRLGSFGQRADAFTLEWTGTTSDDVVVTVHARKLTFLPAAFGQALGN